MAHRIVAKLRPFASQKVAVYRTHAEDSQEIFVFAEGVDSLMSKAGWLDPDGSPIFSKQNRYKNLSENTTPVREGLPFILIEFDLKAPEKVKKAGAALAEALAAEELKVAGFEDGSPMKPPLASGDVIAVTVGRRPFF